MEKLNGGSLNKFIYRRKILNLPILENETSIIMKQIFEALYFIHVKNYMHRDLKPENILFQKPNNINSIKLIDFGLGLKIDSGDYFASNERCGTYPYMAPELIESKNYTKVYLQDG